MNGDAQAPNAAYQNYQQYANPQDPQGGQDPNGPGVAMDPNAPNAGDPNGTGDVDDSEIQQTLSPYGQWEDDDGTQVWVPDSTEVGMDFTPYDTDGSWLWTDAGWSFNAGWGWGWLPFHYGRWGWFHSHWGWVPGHQWGAAWVDWRSGGGLVGWRPMAPVGVRGFEMHDSHWNFVHNGDLGAARIQGRLTGNVAEGLRATTNVVRPGVRGNYAPVATSSLMRNRIASSARFTGGVRSQSVRGGANAGSFRGQGAQTFRSPSAGVRQYGPSRSFNTGRSFSAPSRSFSAPSRSSSSYRSAPARSAPSHSAPSHSFSGGGHSFSGGHSGGGGGGGGGHHR